MGVFTAIAIGSAVYGAYQGIRQGQQAAAAGRAHREVAESQAELAEFNAQVADLQAEDARTRGELEAQRIHGQVRQVIGAQRAGFAAGNINVGFGSALDVAADAAWLGELDAHQAEQNAALEAWGYEVTAEDYRRRAEIARREGVMVEAAGREQRNQAFIGAGLTALGGASRLADRYGWGGGGGGRTAASIPGRSVSLGTAPPRGA